MDGTAAAPSPPARRRILRRASDVATVILVGTLVLALAGQVARDRTRVTAILMYLPAGPIALLVTLCDLLRRGRLVRRPRFGVTALGLGAAVIGSLPLVSWGPGRAPVGPANTGQAPAARPLTLLQWNVRWGGTSGEAGWQSIIDEILSRRPDVLILSEAPAERRTAELLARLGPRWSWAHVENRPNSRYLYRLVIASRWPVESEGSTPISTGVCLRATIATATGTLRVLAVDGMSDPTLPRGPRLAEVLAECRQAGSRGQPIDVIAGDFNAVGRSLGFDAYPAAGFTLASTLATGWRGTYPSRLPIYDIDHVWAGAGARPIGCWSFSNPATDHRGQVVHIEMPRRSG